MLRFLLRLTCRCSAIGSAENPEKKKRVRAYSCVYLRCHGDACRVVQLVVVFLMKFQSNQETCETNPWPKSTCAAKHFVKALAKKVKIKLAGVLSEDKNVSFLDRSIRRDNQTDGILVSLPKGYFQTTYEAYGRSRVRPRLICARPLKQVPGTGVQLVTLHGAPRRYFISILSRGQSQPRAVHEACLRAFLRYLMSVDHHEQLLSCDDHVGRIVAYVDRNWASEKNNSRRSLSGCVIFVDNAVVQAYTRQQTSIALSSAEAELTAISEGMKECVGLAVLVKHVYRTELEVPVVLSDSRAAINISTMEGLLRRVRHVDIRLCWAQDALQENKARLEWVSGAQNVAGQISLRRAT